MGGSNMYLKDKSVRNINNEIGVIISDFGSEIVVKYSSTKTFKYSIPSAFDRGLITLLDVDYVEKTEAKKEIQSATQKLKYKRIFSPTHKEFIHRVFGDPNGTYGKSFWHYPKISNFIVWMVKFYGHDDLKWENRIFPDYIRERYIGDESHPTWNGKPVNLNTLVGPKRLAVSVDKRNDSFVYDIKGVYILDRGKSTDLERIFVRIPDEEAFKLIPEAFEH